MAVALRDWQLCDHPTEEEKSEATGASSASLSPTLALRVNVIADITSVGRMILRISQIVFFSLLNGSAIFNF